VTSSHKLTSEQFAALAAGDGDHQTIRDLHAGQLSKNIVKILAIRQMADAIDGSTAGSDFATSFTLLAEVQQHSPDTVARILEHPQISAWAGACMRRLRSADTADVMLMRDLSYLGAVAAAAAVAAGHPFTVMVGMQDGQLMLPTLGLARLSTSLPYGVATVRYDGSQLSITEPHGTTVAVTDTRVDAPGWWSLRQLTAEAEGVRLVVDLDDIGPYRDSGEITATGRTPDQIVGEWQRLLTEAWRLLVEVGRDRAIAIAAGLRSLIPARRSSSAVDSSATSSDAFGAIWLGLPYSPTLFAETLVHEFQHSKLGALNDLVSLWAAGDDELFYSPARDDPRPLAGMLHGAYAYAGVADFWRRSRDARPDQHAQMQFNRWREQVERVGDALLHTGRLTPRGVEFVTIMRNRMRAWNDTVNSQAGQMAARDDADDHYLRWRLANLHPDETEVAALATAWLGDQPAIALAYTEPVPRPAVFAHRINPRLQLRQLREIDPQRFRTTTENASADSALGAASAGDIAYLNGDPRGAVTMYVAQIAGDPENIEHWAGLVLARRQFCDDAASASLQQHPELVRAVYLAVRAVAGHPAGPVEMAAWLGEISSASPLPDGQVVGAAARSA
jgi:HEXXH motif-containing protein